MEGKDMAKERQGTLRNIYAPSYQSVFVTDGAGSLNLRDGYIILDLYNEHQGFPQEQQAPIEGGKMKVPQTTENPIVVREFQVRLHIPIESAERIGKWLQNQHKAAEDAKHGV
jgi:hypothetical protein